MTLCSKHTSALPVENLFCLAGRGQLGLGDLVTRATPSRVGGVLEGVHVRVVTCGAQVSPGLL